MKDKKEEKRLAAIKHGFYNARVSFDKNGGNKGVELDIDRLQILTILKDNGFFRYDINKQTGAYIFIQVTNKVVKEVSVTAIRDFWFNYLENLPIYNYPTAQTDDEGNPRKLVIKPEMLINKFLGSIGNYLSEQILDRLTPDEEIEFIKDQKDCKYIFYKNGWLKISADKIEANQNYSELQGYIWHNQILQRNLNLKSQNQYNGYFFQFLQNIAGNKQQRFKAMQTIIGYLLHNYYDYKLKAPILTDAFIGSDGEANGRTGKGLFSLGLKYMMNDFNSQTASCFVNINGKNFDIKDKHRYADGSINTTLVHLEDIKAYTNIEDFFNDITEGLIVDKKNEKPFRVYSKLFFSTNKTIRIDGGSAKDRTVIYEFSDHYRAEFSPQDEFKHWFFKEWNEQEWNNYDNTMIYSIQQFFIAGQIIEAETINLNRRTLIEHTAREFVNFIDFYKFNDQDHKDEKPKGYYLICNENEQEYNKKELYNEFCEAYPDYLKNKNFTQQRFTKWIKLYAQSSELIQPLTEFDERRSNGKDYIRFKRKL